MTIITNYEAEILSRVIAPTKPGFSSEVARSILTLSFDAEDTNRMNELSLKASDGMLSEDEQQELDGFERVGHLLAILQSKARTSLEAVATDAMES